MTALDPTVATSTTDKISETSGIFAGAQANYAARGIATFPIGPDKRPLVQRYDQIGLRYSATLAQNPAFASASGIGFVAGSRSRITVIDVDRRGSSKNDGTTPSTRVPSRTRRTKPAAAGLRRGQGGFAGRRR